MNSLKIQNVLFLTSDPIGSRMAGPGIRSVCLAQALKDHGFNVQIATTGTCSAIENIPSVHVDKNDSRNFSELENWADAIVFQALGFEEFPKLRKSRKFLVADAYAPVVFENLARLEKQPGSLANFAISEASRIQRELIFRSDLLLCANQNQRNFYLGVLSGITSIDSVQYSAHPNLDSRVLVVPFGLSRELPTHHSQVIKGRVTGIGEKDKVVLWSGGLYEWFDLENLIRAFALISQSNSSVKLFFMGGRHPNSDIPDMPVVLRAKQLARQLGILDKSVFFNDSWVEYEERASYLLEADLGITTHFDTLETTFSFRTRMLDYIWAGLPVVSTEGDFFSDQIKRLNLGKVADFESPEEIADSILGLLNDNDEYFQAKSNIEKLKNDFYWDKVAAPLINALENAPLPRAKKDKRYLLLPLRRNSVINKFKPAILHSREILRTEGLSSLLKKVWQKIVK
ncbi:glycosyltransferase involved in cell wall biosynthesis [Aurantimicrobium minutum]|nr:glycosyltransferase involved in cell wall biosynthesis [Aurantimicrobium minutum]